MKKLKKNFFLKMENWVNKKNQCAQTLLLICSE